MLNVGSLTSATSLDNCERIAVCARNALPRKETSPKRERVETTAVVQRVMVKTSEYDDGMLVGVVLVTCLI